MLNIIKQTFTLWKDLWSERNEVVHGVENKNKISERKRRVYAELQYIYSRRKLYLEKDKELLFETVEKHQELPISSIRNWLLLYKDVFTSSAVVAKRNALRGVKKIQNYFKIT